MALARLCLSKALAGQARALARPSYAAAPATASSCVIGLNLHPFFSSAAADAATGPPSGGDANRRDVAVMEQSTAPRSGGRWAWRDLRDFTPFRLVGGLGSALSQVAETLLSRPLAERLSPSLRLPSGKVREDDARHRLRFEAPGLGKDDVRVAVEDGSVLVIEGEKKQQREEHDDDDNDGEEWCAASGGGYYYHASLLLPDDARAEGVTAEVKDGGVLYVTVPRTTAGERRRNVTEVEVQVKACVGVEAVALPCLGGRPRRSARAVDSFGNKNLVVCEEHGRMKSAQLSSSDL